MRDAAIRGGGFLRDWGGFRAQGPGFRVQGPEFRVQGSGFRVQGLGFRVQGSGFRVRDLLDVDEGGDDKRDGREHESREVQLA